MRNRRIVADLCIHKVRTHVDGTATVVLNNLVRGVVSTTANDPGVVARGIVLHGDGILADILEPDELERAGAIAVDTLSLVLADDDVLEGGALAEEEDGVGVAALGLLVAGAGAAVVAGPATVKGLAGLDFDDLAVGDGLGRLGDAAGIAEAGEGGRQRDEELREADLEHGSAHDDGRFALGAGKEVKKVGLKEVRGGQQDKVMRLRSEGPGEKKEYGDHQRP